MSRFWELQKEAAQLKRQERAKQWLLVKGSGAQANDMRPSGRRKPIWYYTALTSECPKTICSGISVYMGKKQEFPEEKVYFNYLPIFRKKGFIIAVITNVV